MHVEERGVPNPIHTVLVQDMIKSKIMQGGQGSVLSIQKEMGQLLFAINYSYLP